MTALEAAAVLPALGSKGEDIGQDDTKTLGFWDVAGPGR